MTENNHVVYMLQCGDDTLYTGYTNDLAHRMQMHNEGKGAKYTRGRGPFSVVYTETFQTKRPAMQREYQIKQLTREDKIQLIQAKAESSDKNEHTKEF